MPQHGAGAGARRRPFLKLAGLLLVLAAVALGAWALGVFRYLHGAGLLEAIAHVRGFRFVAPLFVLAYVAAATLGLPASPFTLAAGAIFGWKLGTLLVWIGATLGAVGSYLLARTLGRDAIARLAGRHAERLARAARDHGFTAILRLRLIPVVPYNGLNLAAGAAGVPLGPFTLGTAIGIVPVSAVYCYFADALLSGTAGARHDALLRALLAGALLIAFSFAPSLLRRLRGRGAGEPIP